MKKVFQIVAAICTSTLVNAVSVDDVSLNLDMKVQQERRPQYVEPYNPCNQYERFDASTGKCICIMCPFECPVGTHWSNEECDCVKCHHTDMHLSGRGCANRDGSPLDIIGGDEKEPDDDSAPTTATASLSTLEIYERQ